MALVDDLSAEVGQILKPQWDVQEGRVVPLPDDLRLDNQAKHFPEATVLYADLDGSTNMVDKFSWWFSAEVYKSYLRCAARIIASESGTITAYDGDRIMAIFLGDSKNTNATRSALKINYAVNKIIRPALAARYPDKEFTLKHVVGIDTSELRAARIGVRGYNDLVWIGRAANYAAKLTSLNEYPVYITKNVYEKMHESTRTTDGKNMWDHRLWTAMNNMNIYRSNWTWTP